MYDYNVKGFSLSKDLHYSRKWYTSSMSSSNPSFRFRFSLLPYIIYTFILIVALFIKRFSLVMKTKEIKYELSTHKWGLMPQVVFYTAFNSISVISQRQFTLFISFLGFTGTWGSQGSEVSCPRTLQQKEIEEMYQLESASIYNLHSLIWLKVIVDLSLFFCMLTFYSKDTYFVASTTDSFWKNCGKRRYCW